MTDGIKKLIPENLAEAMQLIREVVSDLHSKNIYQWDENYPSLNTIAEDINLGQAFAFYLQDTIVGYIVINEKYSPEYDELQWADQGGKFLVIHRLCVHPNYQGMGIARKLLTFAEQFALSQQYTSIRLDAFTENQTSLIVYEKLQYTLVGTVRFRKGLFNCYEKGKQAWI